MLRGNFRFLRTLSCVPSPISLQRAVRAALLVSSLTPVFGASAHITLETRQAEAGSTYKAVFRAGHGCDGSPIRQLIIDIPAGVRGAKPMVKPGWQIDIERQPLVTPITTPTTSHGKTVRNEVSRIRFSGGALPDGLYDEFVIVAQLPDTSGPLYWKVSQVCDQGRIDWAEVPAAGQSLRDLTSPAALLNVQPRPATVPPMPAGHVH